MIRRLLLMVIFSIVTASCYSLDTNLVVNDDGSGSFSLDFLIDKDTSAETLDTGGDLLNPCSSLSEIEAAAPAGATVTPLDTESQCGAHLEMTFANSSELSAGVRELSENARFAEFGFLHEVKVQPNGAEGGWKFEAKFKPPVPANLDTQGQFRTDVGEGTFTLGVRLPGRQVEHNADRITEDGTMIFEIDPIVGGNSELLIITEPGATIVGVAESGGLPSIEILVVIALFALAVAAFGVHQQRRKRQYEGDPDDDTGMIAIDERLGLTGPTDDTEPEVAPTAPDSEAVLSLASPVAAPTGSETVSSLAPPVADEASDPQPEPVSSLAPPALAQVEAVEVTPIVAEQAGNSAGWPLVEPTNLASPVLQEPSIAPSAAADTPEMPGWVSSVHSVEPIPTAEAEVNPAPASTESLTGAWPTTAAGTVSAPWPTAPTADEGALPQPVAANAAGAWPIGPGAGEPEPAVQASPDPTQSAPTQDEMVWDQQRQAYTVFDPRRGVSMVFDDATQTWVPAD